MANMQWTPFFLFYLNANAFKITHPEIWIEFTCQYLNNGTGYRFIKISQYVQKLCDFEVKSVRMDDLFTRTVPIDVLTFCDISNTGNTTNKILETLQKKTLPNF